MTYTAQQTQKIEKTWNNLQKISFTSSGKALAGPYDIAHMFILKPFEIEVLPPLVSWHHLVAASPESNVLESKKVLADGFKALPPRAIKLLNDLEDLDYIMPHKINDVQYYSYRMNGESVADFKVRAVGELKKANEAHTKNLLKKFGPKFGAELRKDSQIKTLNDQQRKLHILIRRQTQLIEHAQEALAKAKRQKNSAEVKVAHEVLAEAKALLKLFKKELKVIGQKKNQRTIEVREPLVAGTKALLENKPALGF